MNNHLIEELVKIENKYLPIIHILESNSPYKKLYKGAITIQSKININPDILFLGINPGEGPFRELYPKNGDDNAKKFPKRILDYPDTSKNLNLDWLKKGNARGEFIEEKWHGYDWFETTEKINNSFPSRMINILFSYTEKLYEDKKYQKKDLVDIIENDIHNRIIYTNIYPIATKSIKELKEIFSLLSKEKNIAELIGTKEKVTPTIVKNFFRQRMIDSINAINPKIIVLLGHSAYRDLTLLKDYKGKKIFKNEVQLRKNDLIKYKTISFTRQGNWSPLIDDISTAILEHKDSSVKAV